MDSTDCLTALVLNYIQENADLTSAHACTSRARLSIMAVILTEDYNAAH